MRNRFVIWTGPIIVGQVAEQLRQAGFAVMCEGTERVFFEAEAETDDMQRRVNVVYPVAGFRVQLAVRDVAPRPATQDVCPRCGRPYPFGDPRQVVPGRQCFDCDERDGGAA